MGIVLCVMNVIAAAASNFLPDTTGGGCSVTIMLLSSTVAVFAVIFAVVLVAVSIVHPDIVSLYICLMSKLNFSILYMLWQA